MNENQMSSMLAWLSAQGFSKSTATKDLANQGTPMYYKSIDKKYKLVIIHFNTDKDVLKQCFDLIIIKDTEVIQEGEIFKIMSFDLGERSLSLLEHQLKEMEEKGIKNASKVISMKEEKQKQYNRLSETKIVNAAIKFVSELEIKGSVGGFDIYALLKAYIKDKDKRKEINKIIKVAEDASDYTI